MTVGIHPLEDVPMFCLATGFFNSNCKVEYSVEEAHAEDLKSLICGIFFSGWDAEKFDELEKVTVDPATLFKMLELPEDHCIDWVTYDGGELVINDEISEEGPASLLIRKNDETETIKSVFPRSKIYVSDAIGQNKMIIEMKH